MKNIKKVVLLLICFTVFSSVAFAEKIPVCITPAQLISTHDDDIEVGDWIQFKTIRNVYLGDKLLLEKGSIIYGIVDHVHENGLLADNAELTFSKFITKDMQGNKLSIPYTLVLSRKDYQINNFKDRIIKYVGVIFKGNEIKIEPQSFAYNIFILKQD